MFFFCRTGLEIGRVEAVAPLSRNKHVKFRMKKLTFLEVEVRLPGFVTLSGCFSASLLDKRNILFYNKQNQEVA